MALSVRAMTVSEVSLVIDYFHHYVKTHMIVPGPLNFHQAVTRWVIER
jgi:hypothetical protein